MLTTDYTDGTDDTDFFWTSIRAIRPNRVIRGKFQDFSNAPKQL